jgi:hypothetical protein
MVPPVLIAPAFSVPHNGAMPNPSETGWFLIDGTAHLFLENPDPRPVCGAEPDGWEPCPPGHDGWCAECDRYLHEVYLPQIG